MLRSEQYARTLLDAGVAPSLIGTTIAGRYKVERMLGEGGMAEVFLVEHVGIRKHLALKVLRAELASVPGVLARFEREAMTAARLDHPNVVSATDFGRTEDGRFFLALEHVDGRELRDVLHQEPGPQPVARVLFIIRQIASALCKAHALGIVHRDLKPENIMLIERDGHADFVKVLDFGLAQVFRNGGEEVVQVRAQSSRKRITALGDIVGTPAYMAPEQSLGEDVDARTDLYSLGIMFYEMLAGQRPFSGASLLELLQAHLSTPVPPIKSRAPTANVPQEVEALVQKLLGKKPEDRIVRAEDLVAEIDRIVATHKLAWPSATASAELGANSFDSAVGQHISLLRGRRHLDAALKKSSHWLLAAAMTIVIAASIGLQRRKVAVPVPTRENSAPIVVTPPPPTPLQLAIEAPSHPASAGEVIEVSDAEPEPAPVHVVSAAMQIAAELHAAKSCEAKRRLLPRARDEGDTRTLAQLRSLTRKSGCGIFGWSDCWPCLHHHKSSVLRSAISTLESRMADAKPPLRR